MYTDVHEYSYFFIVKLKLNFSQNILLEQITCLIKSVTFYKGTTIFLKVIIDSFHDMIIWV